MTDDITIRPLSTQAELAACVELQRDTWGRSFNDAVPASILQVAQKVGGVAAGAFDRSDALVGFVFGISGVRDGRIVHWSDMLAVRPEVQSRGIGRRLKEFQRVAVSQIGAQEILWTYDPLVARNAHLNFNVFGVRVVEYVLDMYGEDTGSDLHSGLGTDRLIVGWPVNDAELAERRAAIAAARNDVGFRHSPIIGDLAREGDASPPPDTAHLRIAIPANIHDIMRAARTDGRAWRAVSRGAFLMARSNGYRIVGFTLDAAADRGYYLLTRST